MPKRKPRRPDPDPNVAAYEAVARLTGRDVEGENEDAGEDIKREAPKGRKHQRDAQRDKHDG